MRLAFKNLVHDRMRFALAVAGIAFSTFLMLFQGSLLAGFLRSASRVIDATDADLWVMARGVPSFDFAAPLPMDYRGLAAGTPGLRSMHRVISAQVLWQRPDGSRKTVSFIGVDPGISGEYPVQEALPPPHRLHRYQRSPRSRHSGRSCLHGDQRQAGGNCTGRGGIRHVLGQPIYFRPL